MAHHRRQAIEQLDLLITCLNFVQAATWRESRAFLEAHPELLGDDSDDAMQELGRRLTDDGQHSLALVAERHRLLLRSCKSMGLDAAFAAVGDLDTAKYGDPGPPLRLAVEMLFAASWDDLRALVDQHPEVVSDAGIAALEDIHAMMRENGDRDDIARAAQRLELLRRCREVGVAAAFADVQAEQEAADREADDWLTSFAADVQAAAAQTAACSEARSISAWDECVRAWDGLLSRASEKAAQVPIFRYSYRRECRPCCATNCRGSRQIWTGANGCGPRRSTGRTSTRNLSTCSCQAWRPSTVNATPGATCHPIGTARSRCWTGP